MPHHTRNAQHARFLLAALLTLAVGAAHAALGLTQLPATSTDGPVTLFYPTQAAEAPFELGRGLDLSVARDAPPAPGNGRLVLISHGSGGSPWVHADLARSLVDAGFVVAVPEHRGDNYRDPGHPGPDSWAIRPAEISRAIDGVGRDPRFQGQLKLDRVGVYGMSAGGHTALSLAGGQWSRSGFMRHCDSHLAEDFPACVGLATRLTGGSLDAVRLSVARAVINERFSDDTPHRDGDPRVAAIVAAVPFAADFDIASLARLRVPLGLVTARQDRWLAPRFHADRVLASCASCEHLMDTGGGHGSALSPLPLGFNDLEGDLLNDPSGFDRAKATAQLDQQVTAFLLRHLVR
jgi:predicted dienelactone hydrolase